MSLHIARPCTFSHLYESWNGAPDAHGRREPGGAAARRATSRGAQINIHHNLTSWRPRARRAGRSPSEAHAVDTASPHLTVPSASRPAPLQHTRDRGQNAFFNDTPSQPIGALHLIGSGRGRAARRGASSGLAAGPAPRPRPGCPSRPPPRRTSAASRDHVSYQGQLLRCRSTARNQN